MSEAERPPDLEVEARPYGPDFSPEERALLRSRVTEVEPGLIRYEELPVQSPASVTLMLARLEELAKPHPAFVELLILKDSARPSAEVRDVLKRRMKALTPRILHMAVVAGKSNVVIRATTRLVAYAIGFRSFSVHDTEEEALVEARRALR